MVEKSENASVIFCPSSAAGFVIGFFRHILPAFTLEPTCDILPRHAEGGQAGGNYLHSVHNLPDVVLSRGGWSSSSRVLVKG